MVMVVSVFSVLDCVTVAYRGILSSTAVPDPDAVYPDIDVPDGPVQFPEMVMDLLPSALCATLFSV